MTSANEQHSLQGGRATAAGTRRYAGRFDDRPGHFRCPDVLTLSSLSLGTRGGAPGGPDDLLYRGAVTTCLESGINVINTALSDRMQTSERAVGAALRRALHEEIVQRDEVVVVTKGGSLVPEPNHVRTRDDVQRDLYQSYVSPGLIDPQAVVAGNALDPRFLRDQIRRSRDNLGLETLDIYLVEEPELHLRPLGATAFRAQLGAVFRMLEECVREGWIGAYGVSTWDGLLVPDTERGHLSILDLFELALEAGSADHHMRAIALPYGLAAGEGAVLASQLGPEGQRAAVLDAIANTGTAVFASAPLFGGRILGRIPDFVRSAFPGTQSDAQCCLQFVRSTNGITSAVVGMRNPDHLDDNIALSRIAPVDASIAASLFEQNAEQDA